MGFHLADERETALGDHHIKASPGIKILIEVEGKREMTESGPELIVEHAGKASAVVGRSEISIRLLEVLNGVIYYK